ncbi:centrosomal protein of 70 kDa isoform X3 [Cyrtonyx montezumae]|uniref:centrosomal protein of 70 kDa isoform X3 n=1 Tax=Cyrtonyx montezumae TaxID=9017 RepID=UPI0032DB258F
MHGLMEANRNLRDEVRQERGRASRQEKRANELENVVENIKLKICQLEDETIAKVCRQQNQVRELQKDQLVSQAKYQQQQEKLQEQEEIIARLQRELCRAGAEEQQRIDTQTKMFCQFCNRAPKSLLDQQFLSLIDYYESQINQLKKELRQYKKAEDHTQREVKSKEKFLNLDATPNYRALLTSFQNQLVETKAKNEQLLLENTNLKKDLETRPTVQELKLYKHRVKKLEKTLKKTIQPSGSSARGGAEEKKEPESTAGDELHAVCQQYLKNSQTPSLPTLFAMVSHFQKLFDVNSLNGIYPRMNEVYTKLGELTNAMRNLHEILELDRSVPPTVVVDTVGKLCDIINENVTEQLQRLLGTQDIHSIISKLEEHECFFPPFQALIQDLLSLLEISNLDDILPAVQKLKWAAS